MSEFRYDVVAISDALTDYILPVPDDEVERLGLERGRSFAVEQPLLSKLERRFDRRPEQVIVSAGGSPANTVHGASRLSLRCAFIGCVGNDDNGYRYVNRMRDDDIDTFVSIKDGSSGIAYTLISPDGERTFGVDFGVTKELMPYEVLYQVLAETRYLHYSAYELRGDTPLNEATEKAHRKAVAFGGKVSLDLADADLIDQYRHRLEQALDLGVHVVFANREEASRFTRGDQLLDLGDELESRAAVVVVKLGREGCLIRRDGKASVVRTMPVDRPLDTNGAGDAFQAGFLYGLCKELSLPMCARIGNYYAAHVIQVLGAQSRVRLEGIEFLIPREDWEEGAALDSGERGR